MKRRLLSLLLVLSLVAATMMTPANAAAKTDAAATAYEETLAFTKNNVNPVVGSEWDIMLLKKSNVTDCGTIFWKYKNFLGYKIGNGSLNAKNIKVTDAARMALTVTALGLPAWKVPGKNGKKLNLLMPLADYNTVTGAGINAVIWALIALDTGNYAMPNNPANTKKITKIDYVNAILNSEFEGGGFGWDPAWGADPDLTAMAIVALSPYKHFKKVDAAINRALDVLASAQLEDGSIASFGTGNSDSTAWAIIALSTLGIDADTDERFVKGENSLIDGLMKFYLGEGKFEWAGDGYNAYSTTESLEALHSYFAFKNGKAPLFK